MELPTIEEQTIDLPPPQRLWPPDARPRPGPEEMAMTGVARVDSKTFQEVVEHNPVVVVDFYADWCGPCKLVAPIMEKLAMEYNGRAKFTKLDVDDNPKIADNFGVMSISTFIVFKSGRPAERFVGAAPAQHYRDLMERVL